MNTEHINGFLRVNKPKGWTSFDVVAKVRGIIRAETGQKKPKVGHTGTLDPLATGLVIIVLGSYCKRAQEFTKLDKVYEVAAKLGITSTTGDEEGEKTEVSSDIPSQRDIEAVLSRFRGEIAQVPPIFSAIKVGGKRAYKLAREGKTVEIEPRKVQIYSITEATYEYPVLTFTTKVSSGTYIRTLVEDIGKALGTGAYTTSLHRTEVGEYSVKSAMTVPQDIEDIQAQLQG